MGNKTSEQKEAEEWSEVRWCETHGPFLKHQWFTRYMSDSTIDSLCCECYHKLHCYNSLVFNKWIRGVQGQAHFAGLKQWQLLKHRHFCLSKISWSNIAFTPWLQVERTHHWPRDLNAVIERLHSTCYSLK
jgi:hypothetical protein